MNCTYNEVLEEMEDLTLQKKTDLWGADGETVTPKDRLNTKRNLNDIPDVDKKVIPVTRNLDDAIQRTKQQFKNKPYKLGKVDCYQYVESIVRKANPSASIKGSSNLDRFNSMSCS